MSSVIRLSKLDNFSGIVYPIIGVPDIPECDGYLSINCESDLIKWIDLFVYHYGDDGLIKIKFEDGYSLIRIYNNNYIDSIINRDRL